MPELENHHYIQKRLLNGFATKAKNNKYKICVLDLFSVTAEYRNTDSAMSMRNFYDVKGGETKALEKSLNEKIEKPMGTILKRLRVNPAAQIELTRKELSIIKKYILIQIYRNRKNSTSYTNPPDGMVQLSEYNSREDESKLDFWKREMTTILDTEWDDLVKIDSLINIRNEAEILHRSFLMFFRTEGEFVINDLGYVTERHKMTIPEETQDEYKKIADEIGKTRFGSDAMKKIAEHEIANDSSYLDACIWMPLSSNLAVALVHPIFLMLDPQRLFAEGINSSLIPHLSIPTKVFVNISQMEANTENLTDGELIEKYKDDRDRYIYATHLLGVDDTMYWNFLMMNIAMQYVGVKTPSILIPTIKSYNKLQQQGIKNMRQNFGGFVDLLSGLINPENL